MIKVAKFGGSSVAGSEQFKKVKKIVEADNDRKFIVTSAVGKSSKEDYKVTDLLYLTFAHKKYNVGYNDILSIIEEKYQSITDELNIDIDLKKEFNDIKNKIEQGINEDYLVSRGEYLAAKLLSKYLGFEFLDAKDFIIFDYNLKIDLKTTKEKFDILYNPNKKYVIPGFYGSLPQGDIKVMTRGGSDITGSIIANIADCDLYENWTDVSGLLVCDPHLVENPKSIAVISYDELREISYMGAKVLHDEAIFPAKEKNIPINIRNTNDMDNKGTLILKDCIDYDKKNTPLPITGITGKKNFCIITVKKNNISNEVGIIAKALKILSDYSLIIENIPVSVDNFGLVVRQEQFEKMQYEILNALKEEIGTNDINVVKNISLIAIVGRGLVANPGIAGKIFKTLGDNGINIKVISQGSDEINITVGVEDKDFEKTINCIYNSFIK